MKANMIARSAVFVVLISGSIAFADLANLPSYNGNPASDALTRIASSSHFEGASTAALDPDADLEEGYVIYSSLTTIKVTEPELDVGGAGGGGAGGGGGGGGGGIGSGANNPGDGGTGPTDQNTPNQGGRVTPSPGAAFLALIGMACIGRARRRV